MTLLIVLSSNDKLGDTGRNTGTWLEELLVPYYRFVDARINVRFASPNGGVAPIDPWSIELLEGTDIYKQFAADEHLRKLLANTEKLEAVDPTSIDGVFYPGGHGPVWDLRNNVHSIKIIEQLIAAGKTVSTVCHGAAAIIEAKLPDGAPLVKGRNVSCVSNSEEEQINYQNIVPYAMETELRRQGGVYSKAADGLPHMVIDGNLVTGQNPASCPSLADAIIAQLKSSQTAKQRVQ